MDQIKTFFNEKQYADKTNFLPHSNVHNSKRLEGPTNIIIFKEWIKDTSLCYLLPGCGVIDRMASVKYILKKQYCPKARFQKKSPSNGLIPLKSY